MEISRYDFDFPSAFRGWLRQNNLIIHTVGNDEILSFSEGLNFLSIFDESDFFYRKTVAAVF